VKPQPSSTTRRGAISGPLNFRIIRPHCIKSTYASCRRRHNYTTADREICRMPHLPSVKRFPRRRVSRGYIPSSTVITKPPASPLSLPLFSLFRPFYFASARYTPARTAAVQYTMTENSRDAMRTYNTNLATATTRENQ